MRTTATTPAASTISSVSAAVGLPVPESAIELAVDRQVRALVRVLRGECFVEVDAMSGSVSRLHVPVGVRVRAREDLQRLGGVAHELLNGHVTRGHVEMKRGAR